MNPKIVIAFYFLLSIFCLAEEAKLQKRGLSEFANYELNPISYPTILPFTLDNKETFPIFSQTEDFFSSEATDKNPRQFKINQSPDLNAKHLNFLQNDKFRDLELLTHSEVYQPLSISQSYSTFPQSAIQDTNNVYVFPRAYQFLIGQYLNNAEDKDIKPIVEESQE